MKLHSWKPLKPQNLFYAGYLVFSTALLVLLIEMALWGGDLVTWGKLPVLFHGDYPSNPKDFLKVAVFGESSAQGFNADYGFANVLVYELKRRSSRPPYLKNYAREGFPFHGYQAEIVKANIHRYDVFLIYAGHNEVHNYLDSSGKFRKPEFKKYRTFRIKPGDDWSLARRILEEHSRIYALLWRYRQHSLDSAVKRAGGWNVPMRWEEFMPEGVLPPDERKKIDTNFQADLEEIGRLAQKYHKQVIIMGVPSCEDWKPMFSVRNNELSREESARWSSEYRQGELLCQEGNFKDALSHFEIAHAIDGGVAILNYRIGMTLVNLGRLEESHKFLRWAIDTDGFPVRALNSLSVIAESVADRFPNVHYCDMVTTFENLVDRGCRWRELFADFQHPSFAGHVVIAHNFLSKIQESEPFGYQKPEFDSGKLNELVALYHKRFGFSPEDQAKTASLRVIWAYGTSEISAYPEEFFALAEESLRLGYESTDKGSGAEQNFKYWMNLIQARRAERPANR
jgi:hypothetical protein